MICIYSGYSIVILHPGESPEKKSGILRLVGRRVHHWTAAGNRVILAEIHYP